MPSPPLQEAALPILPSQPQGHSPTAASPSKPPPPPAAAPKKLPGFGAESRRVLSLALPITVSQVLSFLGYLITTAQVGHLGSAELSAITLGRSIFHITGLSLVMGLGSGVGTLAGQAFGARQAPLVAAVTQRAVLLNLVLAALVVCGWSQAEGLMVRLGQDPEMSRLAAQYVRCISPALVFEAVLACLHGHLMCQGIVTPLTVVAVVCTVLTPAVNHIFIRVLDMGLLGVAAAYNLVILINLLLVALAVYWLDPPTADPRHTTHDDHDTQAEEEDLSIATPLDSSHRLHLDLRRVLLPADAPPGAERPPELHPGPGRTRLPPLPTAGRYWSWSWASVCSPGGCGHYLRVALPSLAMICADWWCFEAMILVAGMQPDAGTQLAVMGILFSTHSLVFFFNEGFSGAVSTRCSNLLGAGAGEQARHTVAVCLVLASVTSISCALSFRLGRVPWARLFSSDDKVLAATVAAMPWMCLSLIGDGCVSVFIGVLTGSGRQGLGFAANLVSFWMVGLPLSWWWAGSRGAEGMWMAMSLVSSLQATVLALAVLNFDWRREAARAHQNVKQGQSSLEGELWAGEGGQCSQDGEQQQQQQPILRHHGIYDM